MAVTQPRLAGERHAHDPTRVSRSWLFLTVPIAIAALALLSWTIRNLVRTVRASVVTSMPIRAEQPIVFTAPGEFMLNLETPFGRSLPNNFGYALSSANDPGRDLLTRMLGHNNVSSMSRTRRGLSVFTIASAGTYTLRINGIESAVDYGDFAVVITRPFGLMLVLHVLALIALGFAVIGSIVLSGLILSGKLPGPTL